MNMLEMKKLLKSQFALEIDLIDLVEECLTDIFNDVYEGKSAVQIFRNSYDAFELEGCLSSLKYIRTQIESSREYAKKWKEKQAQEKLLKETT
jgi:hypothetical protein